MTGQGSSTLHVDIRRHAVDAHFTLPLGAAEITVLFGPSGAGKTTILRCLAGLDRITAGRIHDEHSVWDDGRRVRPARSRGIGYLFQDLALFPHLTVEENVAYGLHRIPRAERAEAVASALDIAEVPGFQKRRPAELSGGEAQRVALARAIAPRPRLLLLDEPLSSLDGPTRTTLQASLRHVILNTGIPAVLVTHDRDEALALADRALILIDGRIHQEDTPDSAFNRPATASVAAAVGIDNIVPARILTRTDTTAVVRIGDTSLTATLPDAGEVRPGSNVVACIRGGCISLSPRPDTSGNTLAARVVRVTHRSDLTRVDLDAGFPLTCLATRPHLPTDLAPGARVTVAIPHDRIHLAAAP